jgi:N utilization substance protein B
MGARREARELALMILYGIDLTGDRPEPAVERFFMCFGGGEDLDPPPPYEPPSTEPPPVITDQARRFAIRLIEGVTQERESIDQEIQRVSTHWRLDRMARVDRNLLRMSAYEILHLEPEVPRKVAINEAVEIAKRFGTAESSAFINGVLDRIKR